MRTALVAALLVGLPLRADDVGLKVPPGFKVTLWADHTLANDIFTMALDDQGRVVVSGPDYVRRLEDTKGTGKADTATDVEPTKTGLMGLCYRMTPAGERRTILSGDGELSIHDSWKPIAEGERSDSRYGILAAWKFSEHGGHAVKFGPDGLLYAIAGNDTEFGKWKQADWSSIRSPEAGGILRLWDPPAFRPEVIAHGFRNPYDFDFTPYGDIITFDSDTERDYLLPWYIPTRVYHVLPGAHHGWRLTGYTRSLGRPDYYPDTVETLADMGRGSPTGVCCYRHTQFPEHYRGGVFLLDWTFGKVYFLPLIPEGSSYRKVKPEVFLEPTGTNGFAPTAARVAPDGSLFISIGGRGTRGAVYKVEYVGDGVRRIPPAEPSKEIDRVLNAPQPLEGWSEARWRPLLEAVSIEAVLAVAADENEPVARRVRAIELSAHYALLDSEKIVDPLLRSRSEFVRARLAWAMGMESTNPSWEVLVRLLEDESPRVRVAALTAVADRGRSDRTKRLVPMSPLVRNLRDPDARVRLAAARVASQLPEEVRYHLAGRGADVDPRIVCSAIIAEAMAGNSTQRLMDYTSSAQQAWKRARSAEERTDLIRALMLCLGDWNLTSPRVELLSAYSLGSGRPKDDAYVRLLTRGLVRDLLPKFPSDNSHENYEAARLLAMLETDEPDAVRKVQSLITGRSHPTDDFHYLTVLSRLTAPRDAAQTRQVADALLGMEKKLDGRQLRIKQNWSARLGELTVELLRAYPGLDKVLAGHPGLVQPGHVVIACKLADRPRAEAAGRFLTTLRTDEEFPPSAELVDLIAGLPAEDARPVLRARWSDRSMRDAIVRLLSDRPDAADQNRFLEVLENASSEVARTCVSALSAIPRDPSPARLVPVLLRLRQSFSEPKEAVLRGEMVGLLNRQAGQGFRILETKTDAKSLGTAYQPIFEWFEKTYPAEAKKLNAAGEDEAAIRAMLPAVRWEAGDAERGRKLFRDRGCQTCHGGSSRIGPDLAGVSKRFSRDDLLTAIVNPSRDVAPAYRVSNIELKDGKRLAGIVVFESADGLIVQTGAAETVRLATADIESRSPSPKSLMPDGLLKGVKPDELADLFAFLKDQ